MNSEKLIDTVRVRHHECDAAGRLKLHSLLDFLQDAAAEHARQLGFGMEDLQRRGMIWVLSRLKLRIWRTPRLGENLSVETYPTGFDRLFATRQYRISCDGETLVTGSSAWLVLDGGSYQIIPPDRLPEIKMPLNPEAERFHDIPRKIPVPELTGERHFHTVGHADIDLNGHLNNAVYGRYLTDLFAAAPEFAELQINFLRAGQIGDRIGCILQPGANGSFYCEGADTANAVRFFQVVGQLAN